MIGTILTISDMQNNSLLMQMEQEWQKYGFALENSDFDDVLKNNNINKYLLIAFTLSHDHTQLFHEYSKHIRSLTNIPIVFYTYGEFSIEEELSLLQCGADQVINLNGDMKLIIGNSVALIDRYSIAPIYHKVNTQQNKSKIYIDYNHYSVIVDGKNISLTNIEFRILSFLMNHQGMILSYHQIYRSVWGEEYVDSCRNILWTHMRNLRNKIQWKSGLPEFIIAKHGVGYSFDPKYD